MKTRQSGMPEQERWDSYFNPEETLTSLGLTAQTGNTVDFGCGYGTFALPAARRIRGTLYGYDIEPVMVEECKRRAHAEGLSNTCFQVRDFVSDGTDLADDVADYVMLFNILHCEEPYILLHEAYRILAPGGRVAIVHWNYDSTTPRGPSMDIRPRPEDCRRWLFRAGFTSPDDTINLPPYHYGLLGRKE